MGHRRQIIKDIDAARNLLTKDGWCQVYLTDEDTGAHCVLGALQKVVTGSADGSTASVFEYRRVARAISAVQKAIPSDAGRGGCCKPILTAWNDRRGRTEGEVIGLLNIAAANVERS